MSYALYAFAAVAFVLGAGWAIYVLPTPGDLAPWEMAVALVPAFIILIGVMALLLAVRLVLWLAGRVLTFTHT